MPGVAGQYRFQYLDGEPLPVKIAFSVFLGISLALLGFGFFVAQFKWVLAMPIAFVFFLLATVTGKSKRISEQASAPRSSPQVSDSIGPVPLRGFFMKSQQGSH